MRHNKQYFALIYFVFSLSQASFASRLKEQKSVKLDIYQIIKPVDSSMSQTFYQKLQWDLGLGLTKSGPFGISINSSLSIPIHKYIRLCASSGLVTFRGPVFAYRTERYFNEYSSYGYDIENYTVGNYLAHQFCVGLEVSMPFNENITVSVLPYHLRLMRSTYITERWESYSVLNTELRNGGVSGSESKFVGAISSYNYGFQGISENDFGLQMGVGFRHQRFGVSISRSFGLRDWGVNSFFGQKKETASFNNFKISYRIKN